MEFLFSSAIRLGKGHEGGYYRNVFIYFTEEVNAKLIQWSLAKTAQIKEQVNTAVSESCLIVAE